MVTCSLCRLSWARRIVLVALFCAVLPIVLIVSGTLRDMRLNPAHEGYIPSAGSVVAHGILAATASTGPVGDGRIVQLLSSLRSIERVVSGMCSGANSNQHQQSEHHLHLYYSACLHRTNQTSAQPHSNLLRGRLHTPFACLAILAASKQMGRRNTSRISACVDRADSAFDALRRL